MFTEKSISNSADALALLSCRRLPGRLTTGEAAVVIGCAEHDIPVLVATGLIKPLGNPAPNSPKYFAAVDVQTAAADPKWLGKATRVISNHWRTKNIRRKSVSTKNQL